jgi:hypothetical protein
MLSLPEAILKVPLTRRNLRPKIYKSMVPPKPADEAELATVSHFRLNIPLYIISPRLLLVMAHRHGFRDSYRRNLIYVAVRAAS